MIFLSSSKHSKVGMAGAHTINQHGTSYYGYMKNFKSKVLIQPTQTLQDQTRSTHRSSINNQRFNLGKYNNYPILQNKMLGIC